MSGREGKNFKLGLVVNDLTKNYEKFCRIKKNIFIHSFIHIEHLYSASSRELLRSAPDSSTAKKSSLKLRKKRR